MLCPFSHLEIACAVTFISCASASCVSPFSLRHLRIFSPIAFGFNCFADITTSVHMFCFHYSIRVFKKQENVAQVVFNRWLCFGQYHCKKNHSPRSDIKRCRPKHEHPKSSASATSRGSDATCDGDWAADTPGAGDRGGGYMRAINDSTSCVVGILSMPLPLRGRAGGCHAVTGGWGGGSRDGVGAKNQAYIRTKKQSKALLKA